MGLKVTTDYSTQQTNTHYLSEHNIVEMPIPQYPTQLNESYELKNVVIQGYNNPEKTVDIDSNLSLTVTREKETFDLNVTSELDCFPIYSKLAQKESISFDDCILTKMIGTDSQTGNKVEAVIHLGIPMFKRPTLSNIMITRPDPEPIQNHTVHYLSLSHIFGLTTNNFPNTLSYSDTTLHISKKTNETTPKETDILSLSYSNLNNMIPSDITQKDNAVILGFLMGSPISQIGYTQYNEHGDMVRTYHCNPNSHELLIARKHNHVPINYLGQKQHILQQRWKNCLNCFHSQPSEIQKALIGCILRQWDSTLLSLDFKIPLLVSGLEILMKAWAKCNGYLQHNHTIIREDLFKLWVDPERKNIYRNLDACPNIQQNDKNKLKSILGNLNKPGKTDVTCYYDNLGISLTDDEKKILRDIRNLMLHEKPYLTDTEVPDHITPYFKAVTLSHKTILKILGDDLDHLNEYISR